MAHKTYSDELVDYTYKIITKLTSNPDVMRLVANDPSLDINSAAAEKWEEHFFDYDYVDDTVVETGAFITVDVEIEQLAASTAKLMDIYIVVICSKKYMSMKGSGFAGLKGNRRDNIVRYIDKALHNSGDFGIGDIVLQGISSVTVPKSFTAKMLHYTVPDFSSRCDIDD